MSILALVGRGRGGSAPEPPAEFTPNLPAWASGSTLRVDTLFGNMLASEAANADGLGTTTDGLNTIANINGSGSTPDGSTFYRMAYPGNSNGGGVGGTTVFAYGTATAGRRTYLAIRVWVGEDYSIHTNEEKFWYPRIWLNGDTTQVASTIVGWYTRDTMFGSGGGAGASTWGMGLDPQVGDARQYQPNNGVWLTKNAWNLIEIEMHINTGGGYNGVFRLWYNGTQAMNRTDIRYSTNTNALRFSGVLLNGVRGGGNSSVLTPAGGQERRFSRFVYHSSPDL